LAHDVGGKGEGVGVGVGVGVGEGNAVKLTLPRAEEGRGGHGARGEESRHPRRQHDRRERGRGAGGRLQEVERDAVHDSGGGNEDGRHSDMCTWDKLTPH
jgi:hypothetical protein